MQKETDISKDINKELYKLDKRESRIINAPAKENKLKVSIYEKVPEGLQGVLEGAFSKAFNIVFLKGTKVIEKTFDKEAVSLEFEADNFIVDKAGNKKSLKRLDKGAGKNRLLNHTATTVCGFGLGILGLGLPDIPLLVSTMLKGIYEIALGYGCEYESEKEKVYILRLIRTSLTDGEEKLCQNERLDSMQYKENGLEEEIQTTSKVLSDALLVEKFVQGLPIVGVVGGFVNHAVYKKVSALAMLKYKRRYLLQKLSENNVQDVR